MAVRVRPATPADSGAVAAALAAFNAEFDTPCPAVAVLDERLHGLLGRDDVVVELAVDDGGVLGLALLTLRPTPWYDGPVALLEELYVRPAHRGGGVGSALVRAAEAAVTARAAGELQVNVDEGDTGARRFYARHGYRDRPAEGADRMLFLEKQL